MNSGPSRNSRSGRRLLHLVRVEEYSFSPHLRVNFFSERRCVSISLPHSLPLYYCHSHSTCESCQSLFQLLQGWMTFFICCCRSTPTVEDRGSRTCTEQCYTDVHWQVGRLASIRTIDAGRNRRTFKFRRRLLWKDYPFHEREWLWEEGSDAQGT